MDSTLSRVSLGVVVIALIGLVVLYHVWIERRYRRQGPPAAAGAPGASKESDRPDQTAVRAAPAPDKPPVHRRD
ncbi:MAG TPA: hypothetical protein VLF19_08660 [Methylomirabilota bacterium]|nr:hypothetical protein [Methylomirabilota bacterium]